MPTETSGKVEVAPLTIAGETVAGGEMHMVHAPWDGSAVGALPLVGPDAAESAIDAAATAMQEGLPAHERALILERAAGEVRSRRTELAHLLALEAGKPISQAGVEVDRTVQTLTFSATEARTLAGRGIPLDAHPAGTGRLGFTIRVPIGVVGAITPFNFPLNLAAHKIGPAIAAGCGVILKPALKAPLAALELVDILYEAGLPRPWLSTLAGSSRDIAEVFIQDDRVRLITFTGSSEVGWNLAARAPRKRVTLELGNSTPIIVCADADLEAAASAVAGSGYAFAGQSCISIQRVIVSEHVHDRFLDQLLTATGALSVGDPLRESTHVGPMITSGARDEILSWVDEAESAGAKVVVDGRGGENLGPIVLDEIPTSARAWNQEAFAPLVGIRTFNDLDDAIDAANGTAYGLQAGIYTANLGTALQAIERLEFGGVTINETPTFRVDQMPYGGVKESGNTREGPYNAVREMTEERMVVLRG